MFCDVSEEVLERISFLFDIAENADTYLLEPADREKLRAVGDWYREIKEVKTRVIIPQTTVPGGCGDYPFAATGSTLTGGRGS